MIIAEKITNIATKKECMPNHINSGAITTIQLQGTTPIIFNPSRNKNAINSRSSIHPFFVYQPFWADTKLSNTVLGSSVLIKEYNKSATSS